MANKFDHILAIATCAAAAEELSEIEMNQIVGGTAKQAPSGESLKEEITFVYGGMVIQYR